MNRVTSAIAIVAILSCAGLGLRTVGPLHSRQQPIVPAEDPPGLTIPAFITPHHLLVRDRIDGICSYVADVTASERVETVIIIGPNHFDIGDASFIGSERTWDTEYGTIMPDQGVIDSLRRRVFFEDNILDREHAITDLLPYVRRYFPEAHVVPLAIREGVGDDIVDDIARTLHELAGTRTLLMVSADFSHYLDSVFSRFHDDWARQVIESFDYGRTASIDADCAECVRLAMRFAELRGAERFTLVARSSALDVIGKNIPGEETSHITGYFSRAAGSDAVSSQPEGHLLFSGTLTPSVPMGTLSRVFLGQDANIYDSDGTSVVDESRLRRASTLPVAEDFHLPASGSRVVPVLGSQGPAIVSGLNEDSEIVMDEIRRLADEERFIAVYRLPETGNRRADSRMFVDAGADLVIESTTEEMGRIEWYGGKPIFPSIGIARPSCGRDKISCGSVVVGVSVSGGRAEYALLPVMRDPFQGIRLANPEERATILSAISEASDAEARHDILRGTFSSGY